jgi:nitrate reductase alpha subunit
MSTYKGRALGTIGHVGCFSFHETKNYTAGGEGGATLINDRALVERAEIIREKGTNRSQFFRGQVDKYTDYVRRYTDFPMLVMLEERDGYYAAGRMLRAADLVDALGQENNPQWKTVACNNNGELIAPNGSIGFRWGEKGKWNLEQRDGTARPCCASTASTASRSAART